MAELTARKLSLPKGVHPSRSKERIPVKEMSKLPSKIISNSSNWRLDRNDPSSLQEEIQRQESRISRLQALLTEEEEDVL